MTLRKAPSFVIDVEEQADWYLESAGLEVAEAYLQMVNACCNLLSKHPRLGAEGSFKHPQLRKWRFFVLARPFQKHLLFYEIIGDEVRMRRAMHGHRNLRQHLRRTKDE